jgi:hypothetical protein
LRKKVKKRKRITNKPRLLHRARRGCGQCAEQAKKCEEQRKRTNSPEAMLCLHLRHLPRAVLACSTLYVVCRVGARKTRAQQESEPSKGLKCAKERNQRTKRFENFELKSMAGKVNPHPKVCSKSKTCLFVFNVEMYG